MPAILTLNRLNWSNVIKLHLALYLVFTLLNFAYKLMAFNSMAQEQVSFDQIMVPILQLIPKQTLYNPWTLITSTYIETGVIKLFISIPILYNGLNLLDKSWENTNMKWELHSIMTNEINKYLCFCMVLTNIITVLNYIVVALISGDEMLLSLPIDHGMLSILMSFIVVLKQLKPEYEIKYIKLRFKNLPFLIYVMSILLSITLRSLTPFLPISNNFIVSWYYLRFIQIDSSSIFEFTSFFPDSIKIIVQFLIKPIGVMGNLLKLTSSESGGNGTTVLPISSDVLERRRLVALKVLEERIGE